MRWTAEQHKRASAMLRKAAGSAATPEQQATLMAQAQTGDQMAAAAQQPTSGLPTDLPPSMVAGLTT